MGNVDKVLTKKEENMRRKTEDRQKRKTKEEKELCLHPHHLKIKLIQQIVTSKSTKNIWVLLCEMAKLSDKKLHLC